MMHDESDVQPDYLAIARRRRWSLIIPPVAGLIVGLALVLLLPRSYVATATLAVTSPSMSGDITTPQADPVERIRAVSHELLSAEVV